MQYFTNLQKNLEVATTINVKGNYDVLLIIGENPNSSIKQCSPAQTVAQMPMEPALNAAFYVLILHRWRWI